MGMTTIKVVSAPQALAELEAATGMRLRLNITRHARA